MQNYCISLNDLPPDGKEFYLDDPAIWQEPLREFGLDCRVDKALAARIRVLPADGGWLVRGRLTGRVILPCSRCAEDAVADIDATFEDFEELPEQAEYPDSPGRAGLADSQEPPLEAESHIVFERSAPMLDLAAICWEELMLTLPVTPLCKADCKGLCARCGANLNSGLCACPEEEGDPRMAALRGLKLHKT